MTCRRSKKISV